MQKHDDNDKRLKEDAAVYGTLYSLIQIFIHWDLVVLGTGMGDTR